MKLAFEKWEGLGNDFVLLRDPPVALGDELVRRLCDRRVGVGADGVLVVETSAGAPRMIVRNADGSRPEMCGNGLRCVAGHLAELASGGALEVATDAGLRACEITPAAGGFDVTVDMGPARRGPDLVALVGGREHRFLTIDVGNPHAITFEAYTEAEVDLVGPAVAVLPPGGTNVEFCRPAPGRIDVTVWERGVGRTLACGTGACAVALAACLTDRASFGAPVRIALPGGGLEVTIDAATRAARMRGPARRVFHGELTLA